MNQDRFYLAHLIKETLDKIINNFVFDEYHNSWIEKVEKSMLQILVDEFGTRYVAEAITKHPTAGYFIRNNDNGMASKLINKQYQENIDKNEEKIKNILNSQ